LAFGLFLLSLGKQECRRDHSWRGRFPSFHNGLFGQQAVEVLEETNRAGPRI